MGLARYFLNDLGWDVNREAPPPHGWDCLFAVVSALKSLEGTVSHACCLSKEQIHIARTNEK